jgi:hypothetical protein
MNKSGRPLLSRSDCPPAGFFEVGIADVAIEIRRVAFEIGFEDIESAIEIIVANGDAHSALFLTVFAVRNAADRAFLAECTVVIVHEQQAWGGVASKIDVRPSVVEVASDGGQPLAIPGCSNSGGCTHVDKRPISFIAVNTVLAVRNPRGPQVTGVPIQRQFAF